MSRFTRSTSATARATWSTSDTTWAYCIRVEPSTPTPKPGSPSTRQVVATSERSWSSGSGFSWPIRTRMPVARDAGVQDPHQPTLLLEGPEQGAHALEVLELRLREHVRGAVEVDARARLRRREGLLAEG